MQKKNYIKNNVYYIYEITEEQFIDIFHNMLKEDSYYHTIYIFGLDYYNNSNKFIEKLSEEEIKDIKLSNNDDEKIYSYYKYQIIFGKFNLTEKRFYELHDNLVKEIINFCKKENINDVDMAYLSIDGLKFSIQEGQWLASTDSSLTLFDKNKKCLMESI